MTSLIDWPSLCAAGAMLVIDPNYDYDPTVVQCSERHCTRVAGHDADHDRGRGYSQRPDGSWVWHGVRYPR